MKKQNVCEFLSFVSLRVWEFMVAPPRPTGTPPLSDGRGVQMPLGIFCILPQPFYTKQTIDLPDYSTAILH